MPGRLVVICGLPGAGKTTLAVELEQRDDAVRLDADEWMTALGVDLHDEDVRGRVERLQWELAQRLLRLGQTVLVEWGTWARSERDELRLRAREIGARVELRCLEAPLETRWQRVRLRGMEQELGSAPLTRDDLRAHDDVFEAPDDDELALFDAPPEAAGSGESDLRARGPAAAPPVRGSDGPVTRELP